MLVDGTEYWYKAACVTGPVRSSKEEMHRISDLIHIFNECFKADIQTELVRGGDEPIYIPRSQYYPYDRVIFAHGYYASAMHEIAHWCIAGDERRKLVDFGYWYNPDGRTAEQQKEFEVVEIKPQALEWILSRSAAFNFNVSLDNLSGDLNEEAQAAETFKDNIFSQVQNYLNDGLPSRAQQLSDALVTFYRPQEALALEEFKRNQI